VRIDSSIISSLSELREIEQQRIADERAKVEAERAAEVEAREAAARAVVEAEEARKRAEREEIIRIEKAHVEAERAMRLRVQAEEAAERARHEAALEQDRLRQEIELRRAEIAKKRPRWMVVVTGVAVVAAIALVFVVVDRVNAAREAEQKAQAANAEYERAKAEVTKAKHDLEQIEGQLAEIDKQVTAAQNALLAATTEAERKHAKEEWDEAHRLELAAKQRQKEAHAAWCAKMRSRPVVVLKRCQDNPFLPECVVEVKNDCP
jgi:colicin import membrane protein